MDTPEINTSGKTEGENPDGKLGETRRQFVERLARIAAVPMVQPLMLTMSTAALAS